MQFNDEIITIIGHNGSTEDPTRPGQYYIFFGGYEMAEEYNGTIVTEEEVESAINHETLHCVLDSIGEDAQMLDNVWHMYREPIEYLKGCSETGIGFK